VVDSIVQRMGPSWETFSLGKQWLFATGWEASASVGVTRRLAALLKSTTLRQYTWTQKLYGQTEIQEGGRSFSFRQTNERSNFANETWMTGSVGVSYGWGPVQTFPTLRLPMARSPQAADSAFRQRRTAP